MDIPTPPPTAVNTMFAVLHPSGTVNLRTVHANPHGAITRAEEDHKLDWADLHSHGHRLVTITVAIEQVHHDVYTTLYAFLQRQEGAQ